MQAVRTVAEDEARALREGRGAMEEAGLALDAVGQVLQGEGARPPAPELAVGNSVGDRKDYSTHDGGGGIDVLTDIDLSSWPAVEAALTASLRRNRAACSRAAATTRAVRRACEPLPVTCMEDIAVFAGLELLDP